MGPTFQSVVFGPPAAFDQLKSRSRGLLQRAAKDAGPPWQTIPEIGERASYREGLVPITTGFKTLDTPLRGGFRPESTHVIAGRTSTGRSTIALNFARRVALSGHSVLLFKLEEG